jgi:hypothetical protein
MGVLTPLKNGLNEQSVERLDNAVVECSGARFENQKKSFCYS